MRFILFSFATFGLLCGFVKAQEVPSSQKKDVDNCKQKIVDYITVLNSGLKNSTVDVDFSDANFIYYKYGQLKDYGFEGFDKEANSQNKFMTIFLFSSQKSKVGEISQESEHSYICEIVNGVEGSVNLYPLLQDKTLIGNFDASVSLEDIGTDINPLQNNKSDLEDNYDIDFIFDDSGKVNSEKSDVLVVNPESESSTVVTTKENSADASVTTSPNPVENVGNKEEDTSNNLN